MSVKFNCPDCGAALRASEDMVGRDIRCGACLATFPVPEPRPEPPEPRAVARDEDRERDDDEPPRRRRPRRDEDDEDDYDRDPRPRLRRRRPPPPRGRGAGFWVLVVLGIIFVSCGACCGIGYLAMPGENWRTYQSPRGGFSVDVPLEPNPNMQVPGVRPEPGTHTEGGVLIKRGEVYVVSYADTLPRNQRMFNDEKLLDEAVQGMKTGADVRRVVREEKITVSGFPAREVEFLADDGGTYVARVVVADKRMYVVVGGGRFVKPGNANIRRFLDSFQVTDPNLKKPGND